MKGLYSRRDVLRSSLVIASAITSTPTFLHRLAMAGAHTDVAPRTTSHPGVPEDRVLLVIQLSGGNDGLNTVVPYDDDAYYRLRGDLAIERRKLLPIEGVDGLGLHPQLTGLQDLVAAGQAAVVQGVGYPNPKRSHFASMDVWHEGTELPARGTGWLGRALDRMDAPKDAPSLASIGLGKRAPGALRGAKRRSSTVREEGLSRWCAADAETELAGSYARMTGEPAAAENGAIAFVRRTAMNARLSTEQLRGVVAIGPQTPFPATPLGHQLERVAAMVSGGIPARVYYAAQGGFDTHGNQTYRHGQALEQFGDAVGALYRELKATGHDRRVLTVVFSEFGRRVAPNASDGTDHGKAGPMFLFGPMVSPGVHGKSPSLEDLDAGDLRFEVDFRRTYSTVLDDWLGVDSKDVLGRQFERLALLSV